MDTTELIVAIKKALASPCRQTAASVLHTLRRDPKWQLVTEAQVTEILESLVATPGYPVTVQRAETTYSLRTA